MRERERCGQTTTGKKRDRLREKERGRKEEEKREREIIIMTMRVRKNRKTKKKISPLLFTFFLLFPPLQFSHSFSFSSLLISQPFPFFYFTSLFFSLLHFSFLLSFSPFSRHIVWDAESQRAFPQDKHRE